MAHVSTLYKALKPHDIEELKAEVAKEKLLFDSENHVGQDHTDSNSKKTKKTRLDLQILCRIKKILNILILITNLFIFCLQ